MVSARSAIGLLVAGGAATLLLAVLTITLHERLYDAILNKKLELTPTSEGYSFWHTMPVPIYMKFYFWNITNADEVLHDGARPNLQELGPYVYSEKHLKVNMTWNKNGTITYQQIKTWHLEQDMSVGSINDNITTLNVPLMAAAAMIHDLGLFLKLMFNELVDGMGTQVFITKSVRQFLFDGYDDPLLDAAQIMKHLINITIPFDKFGWFYARNGTDYYDGVFNMDVGRDVSRLGDLHFWNATNRTTAFDAPCNMINGSAGELFHPRLEHTYIELYSTDICRSLRVPYKGPTSKYGLAGNRYEADHMLFATPSVNPDNWCFCVGDCPPAGLLNETLCRFGVPAFVSMPHMLYGDPDVINQTIGQRPNASLHNFHIDLEPMTGVPLSVRARFQINMLLRPNPDVNILNHVPDVYLPMLWFTNTVDTTPAIAALFVTVVDTVPNVLSALGLVLLALAVALLVAAALLVCVRMPVRQLTSRRLLASSTQSSLDVNR